MYSTTKTALLAGIHTIPVTVEVDVCAGMPMFDMVGYLSSEVREAKERIRTALHNCGIVLPAKRITVNLSPANVRKSGTGFDLPIAVALLQALGLLDAEKLQDYFWIGELGLNGQILPVNGVLPMLADGRKNNIKCFVVPRANLKEACLVPEAQAIGVENLKALLQEVPAVAATDETSPARETEIPAAEAMHKVDFAEVHGQKILRRAAEIAAAGMHNMLMIGPPGAGKTMIAQRIPTILPVMTETEQLDTSKIYSVCGLLQAQKQLLRERPFRNPHYSISQAGLIGGGRNPRPGEISMAHNGVLFLDELTEFQKQTLELLRQPMEEREVRLVRSEIAVSYPADFLLLAAMNPCNCGYYPDMQRCRCSSVTLQRYLDRISQPLIDRIDLCVEAPLVTYHDLMSQEQEESSAQIRARVEQCQKRQRVRYASECFLYNSKVPASKLEQYCRLDARGAKYMEQAYQKYQLTARTYHKLLRVARTIADLAASDEIQLSHLTEALCYRTLDKEFWGGGTR